jgi:hypothetical protein
MRSFNASDDAVCSVDILFATSKQVIVLFAALNQLKVLFAIPFQLKGSICNCKTSVYLTLSRAMTNDCDPNMTIDFIVRQHGLARPSIFAFGTHILLAMNNESLERMETIGGDDGEDDRH